METRYKSHAARIVWN